MGHPIITDRTTAPVVGDVRALEQRQWLVEREGHHLTRDSRGDRNFGQSHIDGINEADKLRGLDVGSVRRLGRDYAGADEFLLNFKITDIESWALRTR